MIIYTITIDGDYITFVGESGTEEEGKSYSYRTTSIKEVSTIDSDDVLLLKLSGDITQEYDYTEVENPSTVGAAFVDLDTFRDYIITNT